jgi:membrane-associated protease RseP (regulator of RpoE activity)
MAESWKTGTEDNFDISIDVELLKKEIGQRFPYYDFRVDINRATFFCRIDEETLEKNFDSLRLSLSEKGYIPMLRFEQGEHKIYVVKKPKRKERPVWINYALLIATIITTIITGAIIYTGKFDIWSIPDPMQVFTLENLFYGAVLFALPLMSIIFIHEMGHYFISKKHGIATSLPYFLPIPPVLPNFNIGTIGAVISSREPMPNKKALFDVGIAGPVAGFCVAIPVTAIGIATAKIVPIVPIESLAPGETVFGSSFLIDILMRTILDIPKNFTIDMNPILFAGWVGLLITSLNLLPAGQLDGGHIFRAVLGDKQKYAGFIAIVIMIFTGWLFFAFFIIFLIGFMHPPPLNDKTKLDIKRRLLFLLALAILLLSFIPYPIYVNL